VLPPHLPRVEKSVVENRGSDDEMDKLREALAKAEGQIALLKAEKAVGRGPGEGHDMHSRPLGPAMMPGI